MMSYYDFQNANAGQVAAGYYNGMQMPQAPMYSTRPYQAPQNQSNLMSDWVQGEAGARAYPVPPGRMAMLLDSEDTTCFYLKTVDNFGMPSPLRKFRFTEEPMQPKQLLSNQQASGQAKYVTMDDFDKMLNERINAKLEELTK